MSKAVLDTNVLMDLIILKDIEEEKDDYIKMFSELENNYDYNIRNLIVEEKTGELYKILLARRLIERRELTYKLVEKCVNNYVNKYSLELYITSKIKEEVTNNLSKNGETFEVDINKLNPEHPKYDKYYKKVASRFMFYRYKEQIESITSMYPILPSAPRNKIFVDNLRDGDTCIYQDCISNNVKYIITNNVKDFNILNSKYKKKAGRKLEILPTFRSEEKFKKHFGNGLSESYATKIITMILEQYVSSK